MRKVENEWMNGEFNLWIYYSRKQWVNMNQCINILMNKHVNEMGGWKYEQKRSESISDKGINEWMNEWVKNEWMKKWVENEWMNEWMNEWINNDWRMNEEWMKNE